MDKISLPLIRQQLQDQFDARWEVWPYVLGPVHHQWLDCVPMRVGSLLPAHVATVSGFLCLLKHLDSSCEFKLAVMIYQLNRVVGEVEYLVYNVSVKSATRGNW